MSGSRVVRVLGALLVVVGVASMPPVPAAGHPRSPPDHDLQLGPCPRVQALCGRLSVPRWWSQPREGEPLSIAFRVYPRTDTSVPAQTPIVAFEGGPGYGSIGSAAAYRFLFAPLLRDRDLILMDQRGTGGSDTIDCPDLQNYAGDYAVSVGECADQLGADANSYGTAAATDDLAAILRALDVPRVVAYGDSYGTYIAQTFALRHPSMVQALVLDGAYDDSFDPFARDAAAALRRSWATLCRRAGTCPGILGDIARVSRQLDRHPLVGTGVDSSGTPHHIRLTGARLSQMLYDATYVFTIYRDFPAALDAWEHGDATPLLRLAAEDLGSLAGGGDPRAYSEGAYAAIACHDYPTLWERTSSLEDRREQLQASIESVAPNSFAPFSNASWLGSQYEDQLVRGCIRWPALARGDAPTPTRAWHPHIPVLVLDGEFDVTTPMSNARSAAEAWPNATLVPVANEIHVSALYDFEGCASSIVLRFVQTLHVGDTSCSSQTPTINVVPVFPGRLAGAPQADPADAADRSSPMDRRAAWATVQTVADAFNRWWNVVYGGRAMGLRGGSYTMRGPFYSYRPLTITFHDTRFVSDLAVTGSVVWDRGTSVAEGTLTVDGAVSGHVHIRFKASRFGHDTSVRGVLDGNTVVLRTARAWTS